MLMYTPIDSVPFARYFKDLDVWDEVYTYTDYGRREAEKAFQKVNKRKMKVGIIPHGMDRYEFQPLFDKPSLREKYDIPQGMFLFGNVNKNQPRKDVGTTLLAFAEFKNGLKRNRPIQTCLVKLACTYIAIIQIKRESNFMLRVNA